EVAEFAARPKKDDHCRDHKERKNRRTRQGEIPQVMPVVVKNAVPDIVVVMTSRIFRRPLWKPFTGEIEGQPNGNPAQGRMYRIEQVGMLVEKLYGGSNVARFV